MNFLNKKISLLFCIALLFVVGALVYSIGYKMAMNKFNSVVSYTQEKQKMYSLLSDVDYSVRNDCIGEVDEESLKNELCRGYINGLDSEDCKFFTAKEYEQYVNLRSVREADISHFKINENTGYVKFGNIDLNAHNKFEGLVNEFITDSVSNLIIDLRGCSDGEYSEVIEIVKFLFSGNELICSIDKKGEKEIVCASDKGIELNICVLINENTSGASEIIASAARDNNCKVIGAKTVGTAARQKTLTLSNHSVIIFPDAHYVTKSGNIIFNHGVKPNVVFNMSDDEKNLFESNSLEYENDSLLKKALEQLN